MLISDARRLWLRFWSVRLALVSAALQALDIGLQMLQASLPHLSPTTPAWWLSVLALGCAVAAAGARIVRQPSLVALTTEPRP
jgi:hypothetical protein